MINVLEVIRCVNEIPVVGNHFPLNVEGLLELKRGLIGHAVEGGDFSDAAAENEGTNGSPQLGRAQLHVDTRAWRHRTTHQDESTIRTEVLQSAVVPRADANEGIAYHRP